MKTKPIFRATSYPQKPRVTDNRADFARKITAARQSNATDRPGLHLNRQAGHLEEPATGNAKIQ